MSRNIIAEKEQAKAWDDAAEADDGLCIAWQLWYFTLRIAGTLPALASLTLHQRLMQG